MLSKTQVKYIHSLAHKKFRQEQGQFVVEGFKMVGEAVKHAPGNVIAIYACPQWQDEHPAVMKAMADRVVGVTEAEMQRISSLHTPPGVLALMKIPAAGKPDKLQGLTLLLDAIQDPGNLGTIIRTADWFGVKNVVCGTGTADCFNPKVVQATMGSIFRVNVWEEDLLSLLGEHTGIPVIASSLSGGSLADISKPVDAFVVIGNEANGIQPMIMGKATVVVKIPGMGGAESLNAAVATGILLYALSN